MVNVALIVVVIAVAAPALLSLFGDGRLRMYYPMPEFDNSKIPDLTGKVAIVTGATTGIGYETCLEIVKHGGTCIATGRTLQKAEGVAKTLNGLGFSGKAIGMELELSDKKSIHQFAKDYVKRGLAIHVLIENAGVMALPQMESTRDGLEMQVGSNFVGHYYLQRLLQPIIEKSGKPDAPARVVVVSSAAHLVAFSIPTTPSVIKASEEYKKIYSDFKAYGYSKVGNIYHAKELNERMQREGKHVIACAAHPGSVVTELQRHSIKSEYIMDLWNAYGKIMFLTPNEGATTQLWAATYADPKEIAGKYLAPQARVAEHITSYLAHDVAVRTRFLKEVDDVIASWPTL